MSSPYYADDWLTLYGGDCRDVMAAMEPESVQCVVTSPPYFGLRDYGIAPSVWGGDAHEHEWALHERGLNNRHAVALARGNEGTEKGGTANHRDYRIRSQFCPCGAWLGVLGLEPTVELYVAHMVEVFAAVKRVLRKDGTVWLNLGDSYASNAGGYGPDGSPGITADNRIGLGTRAAVLKGAGRKPGPGLKPKDRMMVPARVALALQADGWWLRDEIVWQKPNPMPSSVTDRTTPAHEMVYLLTRSARYFYDAEAIREPSTTTRPELPAFGEERPDIGGTGHIPDRRRSKRPDGWDTGPGTVHRNGREPGEPAEIAAGRNKRSVWTIPTAPYPESHFATFPPKLVEPMILAGTSDRGCCPECGAPWERETRVGELVADAPGYRPRGRSAVSDPLVNVGMASARTGGQPAPNHHLQRETTGWRHTCKHTADPVPCTVLDIFGGSGTVGMVAQSLSRRAVLIDLNPDYLAQCLRRNAQSPLGLESA